MKINGNKTVFPVRLLVEVSENYSELMTGLRAKLKCRIDEYK